MLQIVIALMRVLLGVLLAAGGVLSASIGLWFMAGLHTQIVGGGALLVVASFLFAAAFFTGSRTVLAPTLRVPGAA